MLFHRWREEVNLPSRKSDFSATLSSPNVEAPKGKGPECHDRENAQHPTSRILKNNAAGQEGQIVPYRRTGITSHTNCRGAVASCPYILQ